MDLLEARQMRTGYVLCVTCGALNFLYSVHRWPADAPYRCTYCRDETPETETALPELVAVPDGDEAIREHLTGDHRLHPWLLERLDLAALHRDLHGSTRLREPEHRHS